MEMPANVLTPLKFAENVSDLFNNNNKVHTKMFDEDWCRRQNMNGFLSVAAGSTISPVFLEINYQV